MEKFCLTKKKSIRINEDTWIIIFEEYLDFLPGQFVMLETPKLVRKPFVLGYWEDNLAISVQVKGKGTKWLVEETRKVKGHGPLGNGFKKDGKGILIVSPTCLTMVNAFRKKVNVDVLVGSKTPVLVPLEFDVVVGNEEFLNKISTLPEYDWYLVSGSKSMEKVCWNHLRGKNVYFSLEEYMGCGIGACKSCAVFTKNGVKHVCTDGPIFRGDELCWS
ncbi:dihydroorotate dehydrogenase [Thermotoga sp. KOL6]|uniref:iron-sulfur cluster-binding protein n=1 Tax=Thermotoga sp. KOL6 TaxID=126741 RepID=UPI000C76AF83|nr:dihydroorotate dehydrogenase [Thermotoga sp. KOL6]PLV59073.1 dihydroorotate dehydrogenase [Thermotoga sp. KOL6]